MKKIIGKEFAVIFLIISTVFFLVQCINNGEEEVYKKEKGVEITEVRKIKFQQYAGSATCITCHKKIYETHVHTAHYFTSRPAEEKFIKGSFEKDRNVYVFHPGLSVSMEKRDSGLYEVAYSNGVEKAARRFDIVMGSGAKGQTYLWWRGANLYQLPITYFTAADQWCNSPGFPDKVDFVRPITSRCLECHTTYVNTTSPVQQVPEEYDHNQILYGVDCEKCHGPAEKHVEYQLQNPKDSTAKYIINPARLTRQQNLELCALCHGGRLQKIKPSFEFTAGDKLSDYFVPNTTGPTVGDVHGNQYGMLRESKCFLRSGTLTCVTCHNPHENERGKIALLSQRCITCHNTEQHTFCKIDPARVPSMKSNCIDCHMPKQRSMSIAVLLPGDVVPTAALIRTHLIKIYPEETEKVISMMKRQSVK
ncbi:MAG: multiheme c-type cytochrome [Ginsengibacter sp.]